MTGEGVNAKVLPPSAQLLSEHDVHQLRVGVLLLQSYVGGVCLVVDVIQTNVSEQGELARDVDDTSIAGSFEFFPQQVGQKKVGEVIGLHDKETQSQFDKDIPTWVTTLRPSRPSMTKISNLGDHLKTIKTIKTIYDQDIQPG